MNAMLFAPIAENAPVCSSNKAKKALAEIVVLFCFCHIQIETRKLYFGLPAQEIGNGKGFRYLTERSSPMGTPQNKKNNVQIDGLLSPADVASLLQVSVATIHAWRHFGKPCPPAIQIGGLLRFKAVDLETWINQQSEVKEAI